MTGDPYPRFPQFPCSCHCHTPVYCAACTMSEARIKELEERVGAIEQKMNARFREYVRHTKYCNMYALEPGADLKGVCNCGLSEALGE